MDKIIVAKLLVFTGILSWVFFAIKKYLVLKKEEESITKLDRSQMKTRNTT
ncbi:MAG: hypothetical protein AAFY45_33415 [Bacteroidota bacterium]